MAGAQKPRNAQPRQLEGGGGRGGREGERSEGPSLLPFPLVHVAVGDPFVSETLLSGTAGVGDMTHFPVLDSPARALTVPIPGRPFTVTTRSISQRFHMLGD